MHRLTPARQWLFGTTLAVLFGSLLLAGCQPAVVPAPPSARITPKIVPGEDWDIIFIQGSKVGYSRTLVKPVEKNGQTLIETEAETKLSINRYGQKNEQTLVVATLEDSTGKLISFTSQTAFGPTPSETTGTVSSAGKQLEIASTVAGKTENSTLPWSADDRGFFACEQVLKSRPMIAGEHRQIKMLIPVMNQLATVKLIARGPEPVKLFGGAAKNLMHVDCITRFGDGNQMLSTIWVNEQGETLKTFTQAMQQETFRVSQAVATAEGEAGIFDLGIDSMIKIQPPLANPHDTQRVRYGVELKEGDPAKVLAHCPSQQVKPISDQVCEVIVTAIRPRQPAETPGGVTTPVDADRRPNALIQSDDPLVIALAKEAAPQSDDLWQTAVALEKFVHETIQSKNFSQAFATAAEVAKSREGDCTEHAVLLASLLRARGIPARVAIGLVYVPASQGFGYHMWSEAWVNDRWIPLDATLGKGGIGGAHLKLLDTNLEGANAYSSFLPVAQVLGKLKIRVLDAE